jgi:glycosyltransferase involved in cell wall biosynthesis
VRLRATDFGPSFFLQSRREKLARVPRFIPAFADLIQLALYVRHQRIAVIHSSDRPRDALACVLLGALTGAKSIIHVHVKYADWVSHGVRWAFHRADALVGISEFVSKSLMDGGFDTRKIHTVVNAIDPAGWDPTLPGQMGRAALSVSPEAPLILCVGRIYEAKGQSALIEALALVQRELPGVRLAIVGADYPEGSGDTARLKAQASRLGVSDNVIFTGQRRDIPTLMAACDVFCLPSIEEPFGLVFAEAMASERPVVAVGDGGTTEVVDDGKTGLLAPAYDVATLANHLLTLLRDRELRVSMGQEGRRQVEKRFNPTRLAREVRAVYERVLANA